MTKLKPMSIGKIDNGFLPSILGFFTWLMIVFAWWPFSFLSLIYVRVLVLSVPLFLILISFWHDDLTQKLSWWALISALFFMASFWLEPGLLAGIVAFPWLVFCSFLLIKALKDWPKGDCKTNTKICQLAAFVYLFIGALWLMADRLDIRPCGFNPVIVLLTVAHFHFAGYVLLRITGWIIPFFPTKAMNLIGLMVVSGVPLVAIGITATHFNFPFWLETIAVVVMVFGGFSVGWFHFILGWRNRGFLYGLCWMIAGLALMCGMVLAMLYGLRNVIIIPFLTIPWMYSVHGTLNAVGFAFPALSGWFFYFEKSKNQR